MREGTDATLGKWVSRLVETGETELQRCLDIDPTLSVHTHESLVLLRSLVKNQG